MLTLPTWAALYLSIGLSLALLCTASSARLRRNWQPRWGRPSYARCTVLVAAVVLLWPVLVAMGMRRGRVIPD